MAKRRPEALAEARERLAWSVGAAEFQQFQFFRQWGELKTYANERGIRIMGDIPIFIAYDSADVWANQELFHLDDEGRPTVVEQIWV